MAEKILDEDLPVEINGEIVVFEKGMTKSEVTDRYQSLTGGFIAAGKSGVERLVGSLGAIPETFLGDVFSSQELLDEAGKEYKATREAVSEALPAPVTYKDVTEAYKREGLTGAIPDAYRFSVESIGQNLPYVAPSMVASKVASTELGLGVASYLSKAVPFLRTAAVALPPSVAKFGLGAAAGVGTLALQFFGDNLQRQYEVAQGDDPEAQVTPDQINSFTAALAAGPQAGMDYVVIALTGGIGRGPQIAAARSLKESLGAVGTTAKAATSPTLAGAARASFAESALEFPTELAQTVLERAQAGLSISPQDAEFVEEMIATVAGTIPMTGAFGSYGTVRSYRANKKAYDNWEKLSDQEKVIRNDYENRRQQSLQSEYDNSVRIYGDNVREVQNKINEAGRESVENRRLIEQGVQEAKGSVELTVDDVVDAAGSRNIKTDDQAFKNFVYRTTGGQTSDINEADQDALRAMRAILTGFTVQNYYDADTEEGVSVPSFTSEELESVITGFKGGAKLTPESVRRKLHEKFYSKAKGRDQLVDFTDSESSNSIASSIIEEMKMRGYAVEDKNGNVKARKPKYTETQYRDLMEKAYRDGSINLRDYEQITGRFGEKNFQSFIDDAIIRGDMPSVQSRPMQRRGEFAPLVFRATLSEDAAQTGGDLAPITDKNGRPVIKATPDQEGGIKKRVTAGNVVTEVVEANGYFVRDGNGEIVGGATSREEAAKEAKFLNENQSNYFITDQATGNITYGSKKKLDKIIKDSKGIPEYLRNTARAPDYTGVRPKLIRGAYSTDRNKSQGFAVRQFLSPGLAVKDKQTGRLENTGEAFGARRPSVTELSFAPDLQTASSVELEFAKETMPGAANWDKKVDEVGKQKRAELQELFEEEGRLFRPPPMAEIFADSDIQRPQKPSRISKREKVLSEIKEYPVERGQEVLDLIENKLKEANLDKALIATIKDKIGSDGVTAEGSYSPNDDGFRRIAISLDQIKDAKTSEEVRIAVAGIMDHEIIHAMRDLDLFTMQEWNVLSNATYRVRNKDGQTFFERAAIDYEGKGDTNYILEEAVAEMYRQYYSVPEVRRRIAGQPRTLLERIAVFMEKMYNAMNGAGFVTSADVISSMKKIQAREAGEVRTIQGQRNPELSGAFVETQEEPTKEDAERDARFAAVPPYDPEQRDRFEPLPKEIIAYHGGSRRAGVEWDPAKYKGTGERYPGVMPLGEGVYFSSLEEGASRFLKYGGDNASISEVILDTSNMISNGVNAEKWKDFKKAIDKNKGIFGKDYRGEGRKPDSPRDLFEYLKGKPEEAYRILKEAGVTGMYEKLPFGDEISVFDPSAIKDVRNSPMYTVPQDFAGDDSIVQGDEEIDGNYTNYKKSKELGVPLGSWQIYFSELKESMVPAFKEFINPLLADGKYIISSDPITLEEAKVWESLAQDGYIVEMQDDLEVDERFGTIGDKNNIGDRGVYIIKGLADSEVTSLSSLENASDERLARVLDRAEPYTYIVDKNTGDKFGATFQSNAGSYFAFLANLAKDPRGKGKTWNIVFIDEERGMDVTDIEGGPGALRVLKTVLDLTKELVREKNPEGFNFAASRATKKKDEEQREAPARARLYARGIKDIAKEYGYSVEEVVEQFDTFFYAEKGDFKYEVQDERMSVAPAPTLTQGSPQSQWRIPSVNPVSRMDFTSRAVKNFNDERLAIAYHGSDIEFDKFQTRFIDGAQQKGWGLYFSDLVEVADFYRENLTDEGVVYEVEIPEVDDLFDYDAPIVDQNPKVAEAFRKAFESENMSEEFDQLYGEDGDESAAAFYDSLSFLGQREQYASELLSKYGIKGHHYGVGRFTPEIGSLGARNFVIYDDESISIVKKLYQEKRPALDRDPDLSKRSEEIINGTRTGERLSVSNQSKVKKKEPRVQRNMEQLRNIFPARNEETFFETFNKALFQPDVAQLKKFLLRMRMKLVDQYTYLQKISEAAALKMKDNRDIRAATNAASLAMLSDRTNSLTAGGINDGAVVFRGGIIRVDHTKKSLKQALEPLFKADDDLYRDWGMWMVANRAQRIIKDGMLTPLSKTEIKTINEDIKRRNLLPMFEQVKSDYEEWNDSLVNVMKATGIINEELARVFKKYGDYIPFYRNMDMDAEGIEGVSPEVFKQILSAEGVDLSLGANRRLRSLFPTLTDQRPPKKMKGGDQQIVDPLTGIMQNLRAAVMAGSKNLAAQRVMADAVDVGIATKVEPDSKGNVPAGAFTVRVNGEENYFTTDDDLLIETLMGFTQGKVNIHPFFSGPANLLREMVARSPLFLLRNPLRDSVSVWATSGANMTPVIDTMKRFASEVGEKSEEYKILRGGGVIGGYDYVFEPKKFEKSFRSKMRREGMTTKKNSAEIVTEPFRKVWDKLGDISQVSDAATRLEIYEDTLQNLLNKGVDRAEAESEAIFQAQETLNFSRRGNSAVLSYIMPALPFFNTRIQGLDQMYRSLRGQYKSNRDGEVKAMNSFLARGGQIAAASIAYAMLSQDDEEYKAASQAERDENWIIGGVKIPTPFETGFIFKTIPERLYRALVTGDDTFNEGYDALKRGLVNAFEIPLAGPQALAPAVEVVFNHSLYTGRPVVPQYMEDRPPALQYKYYTSEFSRVIGETFNVSPLQVEHVINGYAGTIGSYILGVADFTSSIARGKPVMLNWRSDELPLIGSLFQSAEASSGQQQVWNDFYFSVRGIGAALNAARNEPELQKDIMERYSDVLAVKPRVEKINTRINNLRAQRKNILLSQQISDDQKRAMLDSIDKSIKDIIASTSSLRSLEPGPIPFFRDIN